MGGHTDPEPLKGTELCFAGQRLGGLAFEKGMTFLAPDPSRKHQKACTSAEHEDGGHNQQDNHGKSEAAAGFTHDAMIRH